MIQSDYCRLMSCHEIVTQAITKPYHVTWWGFADENTDVNWLHLLLEYIYLLNHLPAGCAVHLFPSHPPCELCVLGGEQWEETWKSYLQTWDNKAMEREYKIFSFFPPFFSQLVKGWQSDLTPLSSAAGAGHHALPKHCLLFSHSLSLLPLQTIM